MKKAFILLLCMLLTVLPAMAEPAETPAAEATARPTAEPLVEVIDLSGFDDATFCDLLNQLNHEIIARHIEKTALLPAGTYTGGRDIPVGEYVLNGTIITEKRQSGAIMHRAAGESSDTAPSKMYEFVFSDEPVTYYITIEEGDTLTLPYPFDLTISAGIQFK